MASLLPVKWMLHMINIRKLYLGLALANQVDVAALHLLPDDTRVDQEQATGHLEQGWTDY